MYCYVAGVARAAHQPTTGGIMQVTRRGSIGLVLALGLTAVSGASHAALSCANLATVTSEAATMTSAVVTPPGVVPGTPGTGNPPNNVSTGVTFCRVQGVARPSGDSEIKFEVWLPATAAAWTGRLKVNGTGGYAGATPYARLAQDIGDGFITAGSNMGHDGGENAEPGVLRPAGRPFVLRRLLERRAPGDDDGAELS